ncbi:hypothetical protein N9850_02740 [Granulosicoccus sp.]|nr:hypothetical protein [Granulosicoccus sp.]
MPQRNRVSLWALLGFLCLINFPGLAYAEYLGLVFGRSANPANQSELSVEAGVVSGQLGSVDFRYLGVRLNSRVAPNVLVFGDFGSSEFGASDGRPYGLGALYHFNNQKFNPSLDIALMASYHSAGYSVSDDKLSITALSMELVISGIAIEGVSGYVNFGYHQIDVKFGGLDSRKELGFGAGVSLPLGPGEAYAGFNFINEVTLGMGFRYFIQPIEP